MGQSPRSPPGRSGGRCLQAEGGSDGAIRGTRRHGQRHGVTVALVRPRPHAPPSPRGTTSDRPTRSAPVVLVHGYGGAKSQWFLVERALHRAGFGTVVTMEYDASRSDIPALADRLCRLVHELLAETGASRVHLVGHSLGGVIIRYAVTVAGLDPLVGAAVTVASPARRQRVGPAGHRCHHLPAPSGLGRPAPPGDGRPTGTGPLGRLLLRPRPGRRPEPGPDPPRRPGRPQCGRARRGAPDDPALVPPGPGRGERADRGRAGSAGGAAAHRVAGPGPARPPGRLSSPPRPALVRRPQSAGISAALDRWRADGRAQRSLIRLAASARRRPPDEALRGIAGGRERREFGVPEPEDRSSGSSGTAPGVEAAPCGSGRLGRPSRPQ